MGFQHVFNIVFWIVVSIFLIKVLSIALVLLMRLISFITLYLMVKSSKDKGE